MTPQRGADRFRPSVLFLNNQGLASIGGGPTILRNLVHGLAQDFDITVLSYDPPAADIGGVRQVRIAPPPRFKSWRFHPLLRAKYLRDSIPLSEIAAADVVVALDPHFVRVLRAAKPRHLVYLSLSCVARQEWFSARDASEILFAVQYACLEHSVAKAADAVIVSSMTHGDELRRYSWLSSVKPTVLYPVFGPAQEGLRKESNQSVILLAAGRLTSVKNYGSIVAIASRLTDLDCKFVIAGDGGDLESLQDRVTSAGLGERIVFAGSTTDMRSRLASADIFVHPSYYESFGMAIFEAMCAGVPPVCSGTSVIGIRELLTRDTDSIFVDFDAPAEAADTLRGLIVDTERRKQIGIAARATAERILKYDYVAEFRKVLSVSGAI